MKYYKINNRKIKGYGSSEYIFRSSKVATMLLDNLDIETAYYYENQKDK